MEQFRKVVKQNVQLKTRVDQEVEKFYTLTRNYPTLLSNLNEIDLVSPMEELQKKYDKTCKALREKQKQEAVTSQRMEALTLINAQHQGKYRMLKSSTAKVF